MLNSIHTILKHKHNILSGVSLYGLCYNESMSDILCIATITLAGIVQASLQLGLGGLILLYHNSMGKHRRRKTRFLARNYIYGSCAITFLMVCTLCFLIGNFFDGALTTEWLTICVGIFAACGAAMWLFYFRRGKKTTELWLPKSFTRFIQKKARQTNDNVEAFSLGLLSSFAEMPFSLAIYFVVANCILNLSTPLQVVAATAYAIFTAAPLIVLKIHVKTGRNAVEAQQWRVKNKIFSRLFSGSAFMILAAFVLAYWVM
jgi:uncharacterized membrane protein YfcA